MTMLNIHIFFQWKLHLFKNQFHILYFSGEDSCSGDSGGPLVAAERDAGVLNKKSKYLVGIVSFGTSKCGEG